MNSNETWCNLTTERAMQLNNAYSLYRNLVKNETFKNFKSYYFDPPIHEAFKQWEKKGGFAVYNTYMYNNWSIQQKRADTMILLQLKEAGVLTETTSTLMTSLTRYCL